ncbi:unnamed protein product [Allacma fusca]|uniref:Peptidase S1 domain-containing protein n=1 Tax=Allacma fusca TaxID=39272 RepID=A0A8J2LHG5_9HEXA|nr:unnamed protein product [Allacma fusca]
MKKLCLLMCLWVTSAAESGQHSNNKESQITPTLIGGFPADPHEFPFHISLQTYKNGQWSHRCGGSIISVDKVLTAAHCVHASKANDFLVIAGDHNLQKEDKTEQVVTVKSITIHPQFSLQKSMDFDYAILHLLSPLSLNENVTAVSLPSSEFEPIGDCVTMGWGMISNDATAPLPDALYKVILPIVPRPICKIMFQDYIVQITDQMVCAGDDGRGSCLGDSGGALVCNEVIAGIVSWSTDPCAQAEYPSVYANVAAVRSWIDEQ